ncbi:HDOD domain-containing protein [Alteromonas lipolytica]|uniref:Response regulator n=1 Tax=Alteromonas lipolytica TaxID=1856405 RepID=A0A1E8FKC9_9ALTE|nr:HDOD domain-containing protein [Alteromonas lipolytica]OFI36364.1 hypothetical protein BFC17_00345 [Alteromonas lipolytica]GGF70509.1 response regulator [Alteromonas lipolytica]
MTNKHYAVFIDDDELMLKAVRRTARRLIPDWDTSFISEPGKWRELLLSDRTPDIVFCDYRMPGINGGEVLAQVASDCPLAIRVLMTGDTRDEVLVGYSGTAHSLINKPFSDELLADLLAQVEKLNRLPFTHQQQECLGQLSYLPVLPEIVGQLRRALNDEQADTKKIADIIVQEPLIAARILQVANSAYLGFQRTTESLDEAIGRLGIQLLYALTVSFAIESETAPLLPAKIHQSICDTTQNMASLGKALAASFKCSAKAQQQVFTSAILNGTGRLVLEITRHKTPPLHAQLLQQLNAYPDTLITVFLLTLWCFPEQVVWPLLELESAPLADEKAWINPLYFAYQYYKCGDNADKLADFMSSLPEPVKTAILDNLGS